MSTPTPDTANVIQFPEGCDSYFESPLGLYVADFDPKGLARYLGQRSWTDRARVLNNMMNATLDNAITFANRADDKKRFFAWVQVRVQERIALLLQELGAEKPEDDASLLLFALSLNPDHRKAASDGALEPHDYIARLCEAAGPYGALYNVLMLQKNAGLAETMLWHIGVPEGSGTTFRPFEEGETVDIVTAEGTVTTDPYTSEGGAS